MITIVPFLFPDFSMLLLNQVSILKQKLAKFAMDQAFSPVVSNFNLRCAFGDLQVLRQEYQTNSHGSSVKILLKFRQKLLSSIC